jgi:hypothetical protein
MIIIIVLVSPFWLFDTVWNLIFDPLEPTDVPDNCFLANEQLWEGVPNSVFQVVWTSECGLEECIPCPEQ